MKYCTACGRPLKKSSGPIGPTCARKLSGKSGKNGKNSVMKIRFVSKYDIFKEDRHGQKTVAISG